MADGRKKLEDKIQNKEYRSQMKKLDDCKLFNKV